MVKTRESGRPALLMRSNEVRLAGFNQELVILPGLGIPLGVMIWGKLFTFGAFLMLASCCEDGGRYAPLKEERVDVVGEWRAILKKGELMLSFERSGKFLFTGGEIEVEGIYRASGKDFDYSLGECLVFQLEWEEEVDESDPFDDGWERCWAYVGSEGVLRLDFGAKIYQPVFFKEK